MIGIYLFLFSFSFIVCIGILVASYLSNFISGAKLQKGFGWFVVVMAVCSLYKEITGCRDP